MAKKNRREKRDAVFVVARESLATELEASLPREGHNIVRIASLAAVPGALAAGLAGGVRAIIVEARWFGFGDLMALKHCRSISPATAVVIVTVAPEKPPASDVFLGSVTALLTWPAGPDGLRNALDSGRRSEPLTPGEVAD